MHKWVMGGRKHGDSPIRAIQKEYECHPKYPTRLYNKWVKTKRIDNIWHTKGRPSPFSEMQKEKVVEIIRARRDQQLTAPSSHIAAKLKKICKKQRIPSAKTVRTWKKDMGFKLVKIIRKPMLSDKIMKGRATMAKKRVKGSEEAYLKSLKRKIFFDQKWFSEHKGTCDMVEARPNSPIKKGFKAVGGETATQRIKIMYLVAICLDGPIGCYELQFKEWNKKTGQLTKNGAKAKGITADFMKPFLEKVKKDALKLLGPGPLSIEIDRAAAHQALFNDGTLEEFFEAEAVLAAGKAPDMSPLDAGVCPYMERMVEKAGAETAAEIRKAVTKAWSGLNAEICKRIMLRVRRNMQTVMRLKGGNFYRE